MYVRIPWMILSTHHRDEINLKVFLTHLLLDIHKSGLGNRLGVNFEALLSLAKPARNRKRGLTSRNSSKSLSSLAFLSAAHASSGSLSATPFRSNLRFSVHSIVLWPVVSRFSLCHSFNSSGTTYLPFYSSCRYREDAEDTRQRDDPPRCKYGKVP